MSEALRLAYELDRIDLIPPINKEAAAELRRLAAEVERKSAAIQRLWKERDELSALMARAALAKVEASNE